MALHENANIILLSSFRLRGIGAASSGFFAGHHSRLNSLIIIFPRIALIMRQIIRSSVSAARWRLVASGGLAGIETKRRSGWLFFS